ncbi:MAG: hypothetical protein IH596_06990 [Bacteroidales bacterium]|nr:hypothetical protein [Bacteroidales bacterium]
MMEIKGKKMEEIFADHGISNIQIALAKSNEELDRLETIIHQVITKTPIEFVKNNFASASDKIIRQRPELINALLHKKRVISKKRIIYSCRKSI